MKKNTQLLLCLFLGTLFLSNAQNTSKKSYKIQTIAFYNLENLFDTINDPNKKDEYSPILKMKGNKTVAYQKKIYNMAKVISEIGKKITHKSPTIIGLAELENASVLEDLLQTPFLKGKHYNYIHTESPDWRGIDVALLYKETAFEILDYKTFHLKAWNDKGYRVKTRNQLLVSGFLDDQIINIIVNHWPSQRGGAKKTRYLRKKAAELNLQIISEIKEENPNAKIITMGDFNDNPTAQSILEVLQPKSKKKKLLKDDLYNPFYEMYKRGIGSLGFRDQMNLFDQIIMTSNFVAKNKNYDSYLYYKAGVYNPLYLITKKGRYKGYPFRSWSNNTFTGGFSDHFPVYCFLIKEQIP